MSFELTGFPAFAFTALVVIVFFYVFIFLPAKLVTLVAARAKQKTDKLNLLRQKTIVAEYDPPAGLSPAEIGFLYDTKLSIAEIYATVVDLEQRGLVIIDRDQAQPIITQTKTAPAGIKEFDAYILSVLGQQQGKAITTKQLKKLKWQADVVIKRQLQSQGYLGTVRQEIRGDLVRFGLIMTALMAIFPFLAFRPHSLGGVAGAAIFLFFTWPAYLVMSVFLYASYQKIAGEPWLGTPKLKQVWSDIEGYHHYIEVVEADNLRFDTENTKAMVKNKALPYAIALGFNTGRLKEIK